MTNDKPIFIYLDQNKWIDLARAQHDRLGGDQFKAVLQKIIEAVESKKAIFPLSSIHIMETQNRADIPSRERLAKTMATISQGSAIASVENTVITEIQISGSKIFGYDPPNLPSIFGKGTSFAFGIDSRSIIKNTIDDPIAESDDFLHLFREFASSPLLTEIFLSGSIIDESEIKENKTKYIESSNKNAKAIEMFRTELASHFRTEAEQKKLYLANLQIVLREIIDNALSVYKKSLDDILSIGNEKFAEFIDGVPSLDIETELVSKRNVHWDKEVDRNDVADISALQMAIPYCDIVITENFWRDLIVRSGLDKKYNTVILRDVRELENYL